MRAGASSNDGNESTKLSSSFGASGLSMIVRLRNENFNKETERKLRSHPYVKDAEAGKLTLAQRRAFALEQYSIQLSDATSFASLAGHSKFSPSSLSGANVPDPVLPPPSCPSSQSTSVGENIPEALPDLFQFLLGGEIYAAPLLLAHAKSLGLDEEALSAHHASALAQAYPSYWARLALGGKRAAGAAACAVNFPAWGGMCGRLRNALGNPENGYEYDNKSPGGKEALAFVDFFASPIENLDLMGAAIIEAEGASYEDLVEPVRMLQEYEVLFWDAIYEAK